MNGEHRETYKYLFDNAQPIIRYEAAKHLGIETDELRQQMLETEKVQYWIECACSFFTKPQVHGSFDACIENWMNVLVSFGIKESDDTRLREVNQAILQYTIANRHNDLFYNSINSTICASYLAYMGHEDDIVVEILRERVEAVYDFVRHKDYDIYVDKKDYPTVPRLRDKYPLVNLKLYKGNIWRLPTVHDMFAFAHLPKVLEDDGVIREKIDCIIDYIINDEYQKFVWGYGLMLVLPKNYYNMGWSVHLDHYTGHNVRKSLDNIVWSMELMSHFKRARDTEWFKSALLHLEEYDIDGLYCFPTSYITEAKNKYYVGGGHMGLGESRRSKHGKVIESTAWMMRIINNAK